IRRPMRSLSCMSCSIAKSIWKYQKIALYENSSIHYFSSAMNSRRDHYFPNTEPLAANEMRVISLGTGRPFVRQAQANCSWLIELGNGDKFIMDFGSGSQANFTALEIPHQDITAYFATHLHADHVGDFAQVWIGSWAGGRVKPLIVHGPSGLEPKYGIGHFVRRQMESFAWDTVTRLGAAPDAGAEVEVHEFDFRQTGVVYDRNGVVIKSFPAVHVYVGPVSYRLEWNGLTFVFSGDTTPSQFFVDNAKDADLVIHECFNTVTGATLGDLSRLEKCVADMRDELAAADDMSERGFSIGTTDNIEVWLSRTKLPTQLNDIGKAFRVVRMHMCEENCIELSGRHTDLR